MNFPNPSFFADLDVLNLNTTDPIQTEMAEETVVRKPEDVNAFNNDPEPELLSDTTSGRENTEKKVPVNYKSTATWAVRILDGVNTKVLPPLYQRKLYTAEERQRVADFEALELHSQACEVTDADEKLLEKRERIKALIDAVPMSDEEKSELSEALADVMEEADMRLSPMNKLLITLGMVEGVRLLPLLTK